MNLATHGFQFQGVDGHSEKVGARVNDISMRLEIKEKLRN